MGTWGTGILENDASLDAALALREAVEGGASLADAVGRVQQEYKEALDDPDDRPNVLMGLAWAGAALGRVPPELVAAVRALVAAGAGLERWDDRRDRANRRRAEARLLAVLDGSAPHPERGRPRLPRPRAGDVFRIPLGNRLAAFGQYLADDQLMGTLVRVFDLAARATPPVEAILARPERFPPVFVALREPVQAGRWRVVGHRPVEAAPLPTFRNASVDKQGRTSPWYLYDGDGERFVGTLPPGGEHLEMLVLWSPEDLRRRIQTGENPYAR